MDTYEQIKKCATRQGFSELETNKMILEFDDNVRILGYAKAYQVVITRLLRCDVSLCKTPN